MDVMDLARATAALAVTLGLLLAAVALARRFAPHLMAHPGGDRPRAVEVVQTLQLDPRRRLIVTRFGGQDHLILLSATGETLLASALETVIPEVMTPDEAAPATKSDGSGGGSGAPAAPLVFPGIFEAARQRVATGAVQAWTSSRAALNAVAGKPAPQDAVTPEPARAGEAA